MTENSQKHEYSTQASRLLSRLLFPGRCPCCLHVRPWPLKTALCPDCERRLTRCREPLCEVCGKPVGEGQRLCPDCQMAGRAFDRAWSVFVYTPEAARMLLRFKNSGEREIGLFLGEEMGRLAADRLRNVSVSRIVPVPVTKRKERVRGFNQAAVLAEEMGRILQVPVDEKLLARKDRGREQKSLNYLERLGNLRRSFYLTGTVYKEETLLITDDVFTTGSTAEALAGLLKEGGAGRVYVLTAMTVRGSGREESR